jgi:hypothetical protein
MSATGKAVDDQMHPRPFRTIVRLSSLWIEPASKHTRLQDLRIKQKESCRLFPRGIPSSKAAIPGQGRVAAKISMTSIAGQPMEMSAGSGQILLPNLPFSHIINAVLAMANERPPYPSDTKLATRRKNDLDQRGETAWFSPL